MSASPAVSVIMNCLNGERHLRQALDSLAAQTFRDFEVVFYDNCSTDRSGDIARSFGPALRLARGEKTVPLGAARNLAISRARGRFIAFLDCDDIWLPDKLASQVALMRANPRLGLVCTDTEIFDGSRSRGRLFDNSPPARGMAFEALMRGQWISMSSAMIRREALDGLLSAPGSADWFDERLNVCEEADVFYRIAHDWELDYVDRPLTLWRVHAGNTTFRKFGQFARETRLILDKHRRLYPDYDREHAGLVQMLERRAAFQEAVDLWRRGENRAARRVLAPHVGFSSKYRLFWLASLLPGTLFDIAARLYFALPGWLRKERGGRRA